MKIIIIKEENLFSGKNEKVYYKAKNKKIYEIIPFKGQRTSSKRGKIYRNGIYIIYPVLFYDPKEEKEICDECQLTEKECRKRYKSICLEKKIIYKRIESYKFYFNNKILNKKSIISRRLYGSIRNELKKLRKRKYFILREK